MVICILFYVMRILIWPIRQTEKLEQSNNLILISSHRSKRMRCLLSSPVMIEFPSIPKKGRLCWQHSRGGWSNSLIIVCQICKKSWHFAHNYFHYYIQTMQQLLLNKLYLPIPKSQMMSDSLILVQFHMSLLIPNELFKAQLYIDIWHATLKKWTYCSHISNRPRTS